MARSTPPQPQPHLYGSEFVTPPDPPPPMMTLTQAMQYGVARVTRLEWRHQAFLELALFREGEGWGMGPLARFGWVPPGAGKIVTGEVVVLGFVQFGWVPWRGDRVPWGRTLGAASVWEGVFDQAGSLDAAPPAEEAGGE